MNTTSPVLVLVERSAAENEFLLEWHDAWRCFMFPVTQPRTFVDADWGVDVTEDSQDAALRAVAEATGSCVLRHALRRLEKPLACTGLSSRDGKVKSFQFEVFHYGFAASTIPQPPRPVHWLPLTDVVDESICPISPIARKVARALIERQMDSADSRLPWVPAAIRTGPSSR